MRLDLVEYSRYRLAILSSVLTPAVMVIAFGVGMRQSRFLVGGNPYIVFIAPGILALGTMFSSIYSAGYTVVLDRQRRVIDDIVLSPVTYSAFITGRVAANVLKSSVQFGLTLLAIVLWLDVKPNHLVLLFATFALTAVLFSAIGMSIAAYSNMLSFGGFANLVTVPLMYFCGVFFPIQDFEGLIRVFHYVPFTSSIELMRFAFVDEVSVGAFSMHLAILVTSTVGVMWLAVWLFERSVRGR